jgi:hypothetical protein
LYSTKKWLCFLSLCSIVLRSPPASHVSSSNGQWSSQSFCVYCNTAIHFKSRIVLYAVVSSGDVQN